MARSKDPSRGELLVAILRDKSDFAILQGEGWYRIPVGKQPSRWPPDWLAFYLPKTFGEEAYSVRYYGQVDKIQTASRKELFPNEFPSQKSDAQYYRIQLKSLEVRPTPILSMRPRRLVFVPTTWHKFEYAEQINDLFDDSPLEDCMWATLKHCQINAERQWEVRSNERYYQLDFAIFCNNGNIDVETDGDTWHSKKERIAKDNIRNNKVTIEGWKVLRYNTIQIREHPEEYISEIQEEINRLNGLREDGLVPRIFYPKTRAQQLSLFDQMAGYQSNDDDPFDEG